LKAKRIALDGPVAVGKSSVGLQLAKRLGYVFFDTGVMYRAFTWKVVELGVPPGDREALAQLAGNTRFDFVPSQNGQLYPLIDGRNPISELFQPTVEEHVAVVAKMPEVRNAMVHEQRKLAAERDVVMAGRDISTVVLPWAELKVFLTASTEERARRRHRELLDRGETPTLESVLSDLKKRDDMDVNREVSPLRPADDAVVLDTEQLSLDEVVERVCTLALDR